MGLFRKNLDLSFVVATYDMARELPRTLVSLTREYQRESSGVSYEVLVVDNGSPRPFGEERVAACGDYFRYIYLDNAPASPAYALNQGVENARGKVVCLMVDGARIASPGMVRMAACAFQAFTDPTVSTLGWHLGPDVQNRSITQGYDQQREDSLLEQIGFPNDGYRLFEISVFAMSSWRGWFMPVAESNALFIRKDACMAMGGFDERFDTPGGGLLNFDFYRRAVLRENSDFVVLLGEGTFHQLHGGVATNKEEAELHRHLEQWKAQYKALRGEAFQPPKKRPIYLGRLPHETLPFVEISARNWVADPEFWG